MTSTQRGAIVAPEGSSPNLNQAREDKATLERLITEIVKDYELRYDCRIVGLQLDFDRPITGGDYRTSAVRASVQL